MTSLEGIRIIDFTHMIAGPLSTMILADLGADVVKIEPAEGETSRHLGEPIVGEDTDYFLALNRNKRSIVLDLKSPRDLEIIRSLIADADVVVENFRAGTMDRLGLGYESLKESNPGLIYASVTGFGPSGPASHKPAVDPIIQALSGIMQLTGTEESGPLKTGFPLGDYVSPLFATIGILAALFERKSTGLGKRVDVSMLDAMVFSMIPREGAFFANGKQPVRRGNGHSQMVPANTYLTQDGRQIYLFVHSNKFWQVLVKMLGDPVLAEDRFATNAQRLEQREEIDSRIAAAFAAHPLAYWGPKIDAAGAPAAPIRTFPEVFADPLVSEPMVTALPHRSGGELKLLRTPICFDGERPEIRTAPPVLGADLDDVLAELQDRSGKRMAAEEHPAPSSAEHSIGF
ncbi:MAG: CoA transferase [Sphingobium sp.]|nr:CoA transferase [Sphingobium sp.]